MTRRERMQSVQDALDRSLARPDAGELEQINLRIGLLGLAHDIVEGGAWPDDDPGTVEELAVERLKK